MNMQFGFGGYDPYMMMGYGVSPQMSGFGGLGGMGYGMGGFGGMGYGMGGFGGMGGMFPNYYPMFSPQALYGLGQQFYQNQFMPLQPFAGQGSGQDATEVQSVEQPQPTETTQTQDQESAQDQESTQDQTLSQPDTEPTPAPTYGLKNPMEFQGAGKFNSVEDRTKAANQILANTKGGGYGKVRKLVRSGNVKAAQEQLGKVQQRQIRKKGK